MLSLPVIVISIALATAVTTCTVTDRTDFTPGGLYIVYRDEIPPYNVTVRQVGINMSDPETIGTLSEWNITLGPSAKQLEVLQFGTIDTKNHVLISKYY